MPVVLAAVTQALTYRQTASDVDFPWFVLFPWMSGRSHLVFAIVSVFTELAFTRIVMP